MRDVRDIFTLNDWEYLKKNVHRDIDRDKSSEEVIDLIKKEILDIKLINDNGLYLLKKLNPIKEPFDKTLGDCFTLNDALSYCRFTGWWEHCGGGIDTDMCDIKVDQAIERIERHLNENKTIREKLISLLEKWGNISLIKRVKEL